MGDDQHDCDSEVAGVASQQSGTDADSGDESGPKSKVIKWYKSLRPRSIDLVGDYAGQELFLVEGDSLLLECFSNGKIDFDYGFQLLHATYVVENFLHNLVRRKCNFHIAFFADNAELCIPSHVPAKHHEKYRLARAAVIRHLTRNLADTHPSILVRIFPSIRDEAFAQYLEAAGVYFVLCHDGAHSLKGSESARRPHSLKSPPPEATLEREEDVGNRIVFRGMICWFITHGYNVALVDGLEWRDTKVMTMIVEGTRQTSANRKALQKEHDRAQRNLTSRLSPSPRLSRVLDLLGFSLPASPNDTDDEEEEEEEEEEEGQSEGTSHGRAKQAKVENQLTKQLERITALIGPEQKLLTERTCLIIITLSQLLRDMPQEAPLVSAFLLHLALLQHLPLSERRMEPVDLSSSGKKEAEIESFIRDFAAIAGAILTHPSWEFAGQSLPAHSDVADSVDGRVLKMVIHTLSQGLDPKDIPEAVRVDYRALMEAVGSLSDAELSPQLKPDVQSKIVPSIDEQSPTLADGNLSVLPFSNPVFDEHLARIKLKVDSSRPSEHQGVPARIFREVTHWHNAKRPIDKKKVPVAVSDKTQKRALRSNQFYMSDMTAYAASLTNAAGKVLEPEVITVVKGKKGQQAPPPPPPSKKEEKTKKGGHGPGSKANINAGKQAMLASIAASKESKDDKNAVKLFESWQKKRQLLDGVADPKSRFLKTKDYLNDLPESKQAVLAAEIKVHLLQSLLEMWVAACKSGRKQSEYATAALIWDSLRSFALLKVGVTPTIVAHLEKISKLLEAPLPGIKPTAPDRRPTFAFTVPATATDMYSVSLSPREFQLTQCGPYMDRNIDSAPDPRVSFEPDGWQRDVLDEIDADRSVFVVAPTSAGKTFISFYAMEKVLRADDTGVLVYVAPTKALVNQIAAEIQGRFTKKYDYPGKSVWAIHTRDYRINNPMGCQILVTVPHVLQIMLLAPTNANSWSTRVKRIIFDEIHSIGQAEDGVVWEQLLLLSPCPIIALSATVGNPEQFNQWLTSTQKSSNFDLTMITHSSRYSDLRKFMYVPPRSFAFRGLPDRSSFARLGLDDTPGFAFVHPIASLVNKSRGMPDDLTLEARDCFALWQAMRKHQTAEYPVDASLDPAKALPSVIKKVDVSKWEKCLKAVLQKWMSDGKSPFDKVLDSLSDSMREAKSEESAVSRGQADSTDQLQKVDSQALEQTTLPLLVKLHERDALPAILFNYDRGKCESICQAVLDQLKDAEARWKETSPKWQATLKGWELWKKMSEKARSKKPAKPSTKKARGDDDEDPASKADQAKDTASEEQSQYETFNPEAPTDMFSFANKRKLEAAALKEYFWQLERKGVAPGLMEALTRGLGVHHAGMNRKYRQIIEILFRKGYLRVIIATGTLALGINMPCATVVFSGDSVFLTALNFRQAAGRAGRRGFDLLGNVVFQGISREKACRLLSSRLPDLNGHFPITTTLVLRLFILLGESGSSPYPVKAINSLLSQPRLYLGGDSFKDQVLHHLRFSIEYLRRQGLISAKGVPQNFAGCISHLYYTENSSFAFHALLKEGYFHELCAEIDTNESRVLEQLMVVMAHLFGRRPCRRADEEYLKIVKEASSIVFLPALPEKAAAVLRKHNRETLETYTTYVKTFAAEHIKEAERELPLTGLTVGGETGTDGFGAFHSLPSVKTRSAFVALSGHGDRFESIADLCDTTRHGIFLEKAIIPHLDVYPDEAESPLNAYLLDFYKHGDVTQLDKANGIRKADVWFLLNDFSLVLATIIASLSVFMKLSSGTELDMLDVIGKGDLTENTQDDDLAEAADGSNPGTPQNGSVAGIPSAKPAVAKKIVVGRKAKAVDDWEAAAEDEAYADDLAKKDAAEEWDDGDCGDGEGGKRGNDKGLLKVLKALQRLKGEFDTTFYKMWA